MKIVKGKCRKRIKKIAKLVEIKKKKSTDMAIGINSY